ncbi:hypothetical protein P799_13700 [Lysinibacillus sphaericus CBAM5]|uniref:Uncharacterized protein n=1 Tax=Lysinibacillus sphaericus CBAM5 TaxID=1400869 RepID=W7RPI5_LYSSH|nr:hypothetical protein P799_13700 [Lysinibacillus sphaericus CBAM5]
MTEGEVLNYRFQTITQEQAKILPITGIIMATILSMI